MVKTQHFHLGTGAISDQGIRILQACNKVQKKKKKLEQYVKTSAEI